MAPLAFGRSRVNAPQPRQNGARMFLGTDIVRSTVYTTGSTRVLQMLGLGLKGCTSMIYDSRNITLNPEL